MPSKLEVTGFFDPHTWSIQYIVADLQTKKCAIVDPVLDFDEKSATIATIQADNILQAIADRGY